MKTETEIIKRLHKLRLRYKRKYVQLKTGRMHRNCFYNYEHFPNKLPYSKSRDTESSLTSRKRVILVVIQPDQPICICMYGSKGSLSNEWDGDICDTDEKAAECPLFKPAITEVVAEAEFGELLKDDEHVFENYRDMATLQWVLDIRVATMEIPLWERIVAWFKPRPKELPAPAPAPAPEIPKGLWDVDSQDPGS